MVPLFILSVAVVAAFVMASSLVLAVDVAFVVCYCYYCCCCF